MMPDKTHKAKKASRVECVAKLEMPRGSAEWGSAINQFFASDESANVRLKKPMIEALYQKQYHPFCSPHV